MQFLMSDNMRYYVAYGGRGSGKSWSVARFLLALALTNKYRILCTREYQTSITDSVHYLLSSQIRALSLSPYFKITQTQITSRAGSTFIFKGIHRNIDEIKSLEDIDICWVEEAQRASEDSWRVLTPTIRAPNSRIFVTFNPLHESDPTYQRFVINPPRTAIVKKVNWDANPFFNETLNQERLYTLEANPTIYPHVWEGECLKISEALIFKDKFEVCAFDTPDDVRFYHGIDWGFANDPVVLIRAFSVSDNLYIDREAYALRIEIDELPQFFSSIETAPVWPIKADSSRPETISYLEKRGFNIKAASHKKGFSDSVIEGVNHLRSFKKIYIHERCKHVIDEFNSYSYKVDKQTNEILPIIVDAHNHCIDALRYSLEGAFTKGRGWHLGPDIPIRG